MAVSKPAGYSSTGLQPGIFLAVLLGAGAISASLLGMRGLLCGMMLSSGATASVGSVYEITSKTQADTLFGAGSELARMCYRALDEGISSVWATPTAEPSGGTKATVTVTVTGTWTTGGSVTLIIDGDSFTVNIASSDVLADVATNIAAAVQARGQLPMSATSSLGVATLSRKNKGARGKDGSVFIDTSALPSGCSIALAGSATLSGNGVRPGASASGTGVDDVTSTLTAIYATRYHRIAAAQSDATQEAQWELHVNNAAAISEQRYQHVVLGTSGTTSSAVTLATTTCNDPRVQLVYQRESVCTAAELAASVMAARLYKERDWINTGFNGYKLKVPGQRDKTQYLSPGEIRTLLAAGVTPITTDADGKAQIEKSVTTKTLTSGLLDLRCDSTNKAVTTDYVADDIIALWSTYSQLNPVVADDPAQGQRAPEAGVATPKGFAAEVYGRMKAMEKTANGQPAPILQDVDKYPPVGSYDTDTDSIVLAVSVTPARLNHKAGVTVLQL